eukprot:GHRR01028378.1.p1 GENE.GHRR01028378.1~~GHRR01028378.1.p1  ORF type:complete len:278 (+),score=87.34 GHRR01028378.1:354-1187(+)
MVLAVQRVSWHQISCSGGIWYCSPSTGRQRAVYCAHAARGVLAHCEAQRLVYAVSKAQQHDKVGHPEAASRVDAIEQALLRFGLNQHEQVVQLLVAARTIEELLQSLQLVHTAGYLTRVQEICDSLQGPAMVDESTYIAPGSFTACCEAAAAVLHVVDTLLQGSSSPSSSEAASGAPGPAGFCLVRPPGHHVAARPMGFGLINFIGMAARYAQQQHTVAVRKVLIVDFDVHHGNGTEALFYDDPSVLYISTHQQGLWPYTGVCATYSDQNHKQLLEC